MKALAAAVTLISAASVQAYHASLSTNPIASSKIKLSFAHGEYMEWRRKNSSPVARRPVFPTYMTRGTKETDVRGPGTTESEPAGTENPRPSRQDEPIIDTTGMTERIMRGTPVEGQASGAGGFSTWDAFQRTEANWLKLRKSKPFKYDPKKPNQGVPPPPQFVTQDAAIGNPACWAKLREQANKSLDYDVVVCGGTLGVFFAMALLLKGHRVCVLEAGKLRGREQEWNISMDELLELVQLGVLTEDDIDAAVKTEFPGCRSGFKVRI
jgi:hypothetical protein